MLAALGAYDICPIRSLTQEDPLGLAGGLNLYGFAAGDPVNFSDPFGLRADDCCLMEVANLAAGFGDWLSFGVTDWVRDRIDANGVVDKGSPAYIGGMVAGAATDVASVVGIGQAAGRVGNALRTAATVTGEATVEVGSKTEARIAGRLWAGAGRTIRGEHGAGEAIGRISADETRVYRAPRMKFTGPNAGREAANLMRKLDDVLVGNTHVIFP